jgi:hypothetical protein
VYYNDTIEGPVEAGSVFQIDASTLRLVVMGQTVIINSETKLFDINSTPITLTDINEGDLIEVSGLIDEQNRIQAGYVLNKGIYNSGNSVEIKGVIDDGSIGPNNFRINGLLIDFSAVSSVPSLQDGMQVEVKGTYNGAHIVAVSIEQDDDISGRDDDDVEYEGIVTTAPTVVGGDFVMGVQSVRVNLNTTIFKGGVVEDITLGVRLEVEGYLQGGTLIAEEISFHDAIEIDAPVANHSLTSGVITIELVGLTPPVTVQVNDVSKIEGDASTLVELDNSLSTGDPDYVQIRGRVVAGVVYAEEIKVESPVPDDPPKVKIQGPVDQISDSTFVVRILGVDVDASAIPDYDYEDINEVEITQSVFFATVVPGNIVGAEGEWDGSSINWMKLEIEDEE